MFSVIALCVCVCVCLFVCDIQVQKAASEILGEITESLSYIQSDTNVSILFLLLLVLLLFTEINVFTSNEFIGLLFNIYFLCRRMHTYIHFYIIILLTCTLSCFYFSLSNQFLYSLFFFFDFQVEFYISYIYCVNTLYYVGTQ